MSFFEDLPALSPAQFFGVSANCYYCKGELRPEKSFLLPSTSELLSEESFADVYAAWSHERLAFYFVVKVPFQNFKESDFQKGDCIELFIDTRDLKTKGVVSSFCHHFLFHPVEVQNFYGREITRFRNEDVHRLCHPEDLNVKAVQHHDSYHLAIDIPAHCLHKFDPISFARLGFTYRINRTGAPPQHFAVSSEEYVVESHPATWGTLRLEKEGF